MPSSITVRVECIPEPPSHQFRGKLVRLKAHCGKTRFGSVSNWQPPESPNSKFHCYHQCP
ncbi:hypothetical protein HanRHA438_Chr16g0756291 [Helianthus annuus]|nr:hypothetical protein HanRHA438_Chr16g0756291 [Helianthus annuus]